jgi:hypothetical protein
VAAFAEADEIVGEQHCNKRFLSPFEVDLDSVVTFLRNKRNSLQRNP